MGFRLKTDPAFSWGFKIKVLDGLTDVKTLTDEASIYTHPEDYSLTGKINYLVNTAPINTRQPFANLGAAIDIGFQCALLSISARPQRAGHGSKPVQNISKI